MKPVPAVDRLSGILERFRVQAELHHSGTLCGLNHFDACDGYGYLHVLRRGELEVSHPSARDMPGSMRFHEPTLLLYPRQIGSASCRERVCQHVENSVVAVHVQQKQK